VADLAAVARNRTDSRLAGSDFEDPRPALRELLRRLRAQDVEGFAEATERFEQVLVPAAASEHCDPLVAWIEYARWLSDRLAHGRAVRIDATGLASPASGEPERGMLLVHLPDEQKAHAMVLLAPRQLSSPQQETIRLLVG
jgi:hypothetical protein